MIDLTATKAGFREVIGARALSVPVNRLELRGHTKEELFAQLEVVLSERFARVPRQELLQDLLTPLRRGLGNAFKHGNDGDHRRWIEVEVLLGPDGAVLSIRDQGAGFDVAQAVRLSTSEKNRSEDRGEGFRTYERARSVITWEDGGRTVVFCFRPKGRLLEAGSTGLQSPQERDWTEGCVEAAARKYLNSPKKLATCRSYGLRFLVRGPNSDIPLIVSARVHDNEAKAAADFEAASMLWQRQPSNRVKIPRPIARPEGIPRLVLYDFNPWMDLRDYLLDRGSATEVQKVAKRVGEALADLHGCGVIHGALRWDRIRYGVDSRFYFQGFEACRVDHPGFDLGGFLADLRSFALENLNAEFYRAARAAFLESYVAHGGVAPDDAALSKFMGQ